MNRDDIIRMARDSGSIDSEEVIETVWNAFTAAEREQCAIAAEKQARWIGYNAHAEAIAAAIRQRGEL